MPPDGLASAPALRTVSISTDVYLFFLFLDKEGKVRERIRKGIPAPRAHLKLM